MDEKVIKINRCLLAVVKTVYIISLNNSSLKLVRFK